ncbi:MAG: LysR family transcriptional regulator [Rhizobium sp.]|nr:LysR family transcriptional regulator [Rhizobium sp.]MCZ8352772.1 LysR family transcriptional regulator [Rhizobium sp.]
MLLNNLLLLTKIVEKNGLAAAGRELGLSPATVSERLTSLEEHFGAKLLHRTTRSMSLTQEGRILVDGARRILEDFELLEAHVRQGVEHISGTIRLSAPFDLGRNRIAPLLNSFMADHPDIRIDLYLSDGYVDLVGSGFDLAIRFGNLKDSGLFIRKLGNNRRIICAAPAYLHKHGMPVTPGDLVRHNCLLLRFGETVDHSWSFMVDGTLTSQFVRGDRITNDGALVRDWCLAGFGIAAKTLWDIEHHLQSGELIEILNSYSLPPSALQIVYSGGCTLPKRVRALIDYLGSNLSCHQV